MRAFCFASGHIEFGRFVPKGALEFARGPRLQLRDFIEVNARHRYSTRKVDGRPTKIPGTETLLVPGIPEAPDPDAALDALHRWCDWIGKRASGGVRVGPP